MHHAIILGMKISEINEFELIDKLNEMCREYSGTGTVLAVGDDCAVLKSTSDYSVMTTDTLVENVHYILPCDRYLLGRKALAVNLSDVAAMGGIPRHALVSLGLKGDTEVDDILSLYRGICSIGRENGCDIIGGNLTGSATEFISITVLGDCSGRSLRRNEAQEGDLVCVTGHVGAAAAGMNMLFAGEDVPAVLSNAFQDPVPRVREGQELVKAGCHAAIDISDGLFDDLGHICSASGKGADMYLDRLPLRDEAVQRYGEKALHYALYGGEDYELIFTIPEKDAKKLSFDYSVIGKITDSHEGVILLDKDGKEIKDQTGWRHFG